MHKSIFTAVLIFCSFFASAKDVQFVKISNAVWDKPLFIATPIDSLNWKLLGMIKFIKKADKEYGEIMYPQVSPLLKQKATKKIAISGFIIPIDNTSFALSKYVFASCFFCGNAGPETIMGIKFKGVTPKLKTDQYVTLVGTFRINENDVEDWIYHIDNAEIVKGK
jgi:hypothetical protein